MGCIIKEFGTYESYQEWAAQDGHTADTFIPDFEKELTALCCRIADLKQTKDYWRTTGRAHIFGTPNPSATYDLKLDAFFVTWKLEGFVDQEFAITLEDVEEKAKS